MSYANTTLLLPLNGADAGTSFPDYSRHNRTVTANGGAQTSAAQSKFYGSSALFDGSGDYLSVPNSSDLRFDTDAYFGVWVRPNFTATVKSIVSQRGVGGTNVLREWAVFTLTDNKVRFIVYNSSGTAVAEIDTVSTLSSGTWSFIEASREGNVFRLFFDGTLESSVDAGAFTYGTQTAIPFHVGREPDVTGRDWNGNMQDCWMARGSPVVTATHVARGKLIGTLSNQGTGGEPVKDDTGTAASRTIIAVPRSYSVAPLRGFLTTSDGSGNFSLSAPNSAEFSDIDGYSVIALDDAAGTQYNDKVLGRVASV